MAVLDKDAFMERLKARIGDDTSDDAVSFIEDMTDTFNDMETRSNGQSDEQWKAKLDELDNSWRKRYKERFFSETTSEDAKKEQEKNVKDDGTTKTFEDLFEEREG